MPRLPTQILSRWLAIAGLIGCSGDATLADDVASGTISQELSGGSLVTSSQNASLPYSATGYIWESVGPVCTVTKIASGSQLDTYLTAAHCLWSYQEGSGVRIGFGIDGGQPSFSFIRKLYRHPSAVADPDTVEQGNVTRGFSDRSYDVAAFMLDHDSSVDVLPLDLTHVHAGGTGSFIGHGCDLLGSNDGRKQFGSGVQILDSPGTARNAHYVMGQGPPYVCEGDSGGPFLRSGKLIGVASFYTPSNERSYSARVSNVQRWIASPHNFGLSTFSGIGFLQHRDRLCVRILSTAGATPAELHECEGYDPNIHGQLWNMQFVSVVGYFRIQTLVHQVNRCLDITNNTTSVALYDCDGRQEQQWLAVRQAQHAGEFLPFYNLINKATGLALERDGSTNQLRLGTPNGSNRQDFIFYR